MNFKPARLLIAWLIAALALPLFAFERTAIRKPSAAIALSPGMEGDTNRPGMDYRNFDIGTAAQCQIACNTESQCKSWSWVKPGVQGPNGHCWLKTGVPAVAKSDCCVSGVKTVAAQAPAAPTAHAMPMLNVPKPPAHDAEKKGIHAQPVLPKAMPEIKLTPQAHGVIKGDRAILPEKAKPSEDKKLLLDAVKGANEPATTLGDKFQGLAPKVVDSKLSTPTRIGTPALNLVGLPTPTRIGTPALNLVGLPTPTRIGTPALNLVGLPTPTRIQTPALKLVGIE